MITSRSDRSKNTSLPVGNSLRSVWSTDSSHTLNRGSDVLDNIRYDAAHLVVSLTLTFVFKDRSRFTVHFRCSFNSWQLTTSTWCGWCGTTFYSHNTFEWVREFFLLEFERTLATVVQIISWSETFRDGIERITMELENIDFIFYLFSFSCSWLVEYLSFMKIVFLHCDLLVYISMKV